MQETLKRLRKSREGSIEVGKFKFIYKRPTENDFYRLFITNATPFNICCEFITGWENVLDMDIAPNGSDEAAEFSQDLLTEWFADNSKFWKPCNDAIIGDYERYVASKEEAEKNS